MLPYNSWVIGIFAFFTLWIGEEGFADPLPSGLEFPSSPKEIFREVLVFENFRKTGDCFQVALSSSTEKGDLDPFGFFSETRRIAGRVLRVIDGDTFQLTTGEMVRYIGVDAPEVKKRLNGKWVPSPEPFGVRAFHFNQAKVEGRRVELEFDRDRYDHHQRLLAYVYIDGLMVNALLVDRVSLYPPNVKYAEVLLQGQRQAWLEKRGIWGKLPQKN